MTLGSLYSETQGYVPTLLESLHGILLWNLFAFGWSLVSVYVWRLLGELLSVNILWNQEFFDALKFWN